MALVVKGLLNKQIASELGAAEQAIKIHRGRVKAKMRAQFLWLGSPDDLPPSR